MRQFIQEIIEEKVEAVISDVAGKVYLILGVGFATFFFGFAAGAFLNLYLLAIDSPLVSHLRSSLSFKSAIFGDGIVLPIVNMIAMAFILKHAKAVKKNIVNLALFSGFFVTLYFHVNQATQGLVNWAMPTPWHWNILGAWHAAYMFSVASFLSVFYLVLFKIAKRQKTIPKEFLFVTAGIMVFCVLLRLDYISVGFSSLVPQM